MIIGPESSGKSVLVKRIKEIENGLHQPQDKTSVFASLATHPTVGVDLVSVAWKGNIIKLRDLGAAISSRWSTYYEECQAVVFVVDCADMSSWGTALTQLHECSSHTHIWLNKPALLVLNKCDLCDLASVHTLLSLLSVDVIRQQMGWSRLEIVNGSCLGMKLPLDVLEWMSSIK